MGGAAALVAGRVAPLAARQAAAASPWTSHMGLELYTVRDLLTADYEGTLAKVAAIGYTEVEATSYNNMAPKEFRAMLDRCGLRMPSTHAPARGEGADLERMLEGFQIMGLEYTEIARPAPAGGAPQPSRSLDAVKRRAAQLNEDGRIAQKFGMKILVHNHVTEFETLADSPRTTFDVIVEETDPALVTMQLDVGWAYVAGVDPIAQFKAHPGRFELWHVKDVFGLKTVNPSLGPSARVSSTSFVPVGTGQIDWKPVFAQAQVAGLKHFAVEQDNAAAWGDSLAAARVSYQHLAEILS